MKQLWLRYSPQFDALSLRERVMVFAAAATILVALAYALLLDAEGAKQKRLASGLAQKQAEMKALQEQTVQLIGARGADPDLGTKQRIAQLGAELAKVEAGIAAEERKFTAPAQMRGVVEGLLGRNRAVTLVALRNLPATSVAEAKSAAGAAAPAAPISAKPAPGADRFIFRHGIEVSVAGTYLDLLAYVRDLEALPTQLYWGAVEVDGAAYPKVVMKLTVYTLSLDRAWLGV
jgi:MSHA biogenesis protein MshJ